MKLMCFGVNISSYHTDTGIFASKEFVKAVDNSGQTIDYRGVGAHHQNGVAERAVQTISLIARTMLMHAAIHWPSQSGSILPLWQCAMEQAVYLWNNLPSQETDCLHLRSLPTESIIRL